MQLFSSPSTDRERKNAAKMLRKSHLNLLTDLETNKQPPAQHQEKSWWGSHIINWGQWIVPVCYIIFFFYPRSWTLPVKYRVLTKVQNTYCIHNFFLVYVLFLFVQQRHNTVEFFMFARLNYSFIKLNRHSSRAPEIILWDWFIYCSMTKNSHL